MLGGESVCCGLHGPLLGAGQGPSVTEALRKTSCRETMRVTQQRSQTRAVQENMRSLRAQDHPTELEDAGVSDSSLTDIQWGK